jgi:hypothetical protein
LDLSITSLNETQRIDVQDLFVSKIYKYNNKTLGCSLFWQNYDEFKKVMGNNSNALKELKKGEDLKFITNIFIIPGGIINMIGVGNRNIYLIAGGLGLMITGVYFQSIQDSYVFRAVSMYNESFSQDSSSMELLKYSVKF